MTLTTEDKVAIQELSSIYANAMDNADIPRWLETWADNGVWEGGPGRYEGKEKLAQLLPDLGARVVGKRHIMTNFVIEGNGAEARQTCYLLIVDCAKNNLPGTAVYTDTLQKIGNRWLFTHRKVKIDA